MRGYKRLFTFPESPKPLGLVCGVCHLGQSLSLKLQQTNWWTWAKSRCKMMIKLDKVKSAKPWGVPWALYVIIIVSWSSLHHDHRCILIFVASWSSLNLDPRCILILVAQPVKICKHSLEDFLIYFCESFKGKRLSAVLNPKSSLLSPWSSIIQLEGYKSRGAKSALLVPPTWWLDKYIHL